MQLQWLIVTFCRRCSSCIAIEMVASEMNFRKPKYSSRIFNESKKLHTKVEVSRKFCKFRYSNRKFKRSGSLTNEGCSVAKSKEYRKLFWRWEERTKVWFREELEYFRSRPSEGDFWQIQQLRENLEENLKYPEASKMDNRCAVCVQFLRRNNEKATEIECPVTNTDTSIPFLGTHTAPRVTTAHSVFPFSQRYARFCSKLRYLCPPTTLGHRCASWEDNRASSSFLASYLSD